MIAQDFSTIPVIADVERIIYDTNMLRCSYYSINSDLPTTNWTIDINQSSSRMLLLNLEAILVGPTPDLSVFSSPVEIDLMYDTIEEKEGLFVDINDVWMPSKWFAQIDVQQGMVFRVTQQAFKLCWSLRNGNMSYESFEEQADRLALPYLQYSELETRTFYEWTKLQIAQSRSTYKANREDFLQKINS